MKLTKVYYTDPHAHYHACFNINNRSNYIFLPMGRYSFSSTEWDFSYFPEQRF